MTRPLGRSSPTAWTSRRDIVHLRRPHRCLACRELIACGSPAVAGCGRDVEHGWWHGYYHPACEFECLYEAHLDEATERSITGGDVAGRDDAWAAILDRLAHRSAR